MSYPEGYLETADHAEIRMNYAVSLSSLTLSVRDGEDCSISSHVLARLRRDVGPALLISCGLRRCCR